MSKKGFSLVEVVCVIAIIAIIAGMSVSINKSFLKVELKGMEMRIANFLRSAIYMSFEDGVRRDIVFELEDYDIAVYENNNKIDELKLSHNFIYEDKKGKKEFHREITENGNVSKGTSVIIYDKRHKQLARVAIDSSFILKSAKVNVYNSKGEKEKY